MNRRGFLKTLSAAGMCALAPAAAGAGEPSGEAEKEFHGVLIDTTRCIGCRTCEVACAEANDLPVPDVSDESVRDYERKTSDTQFAVVNFYDTEKGEISVKKQCMHCNQPACASACLTKAMLKTPEGPVIWREDKCMGCRFCMISCPFDVPKFEYNSAIPRIRKCNMCWARLQEGEKPACVEQCPGDALMFGTRSELLEEARSRIYAAPDEYVHEIYGEHEVGGTGVLYLAAVPFSQLGFKTQLGTEAYPALTTGFLYSVPIVLTLWPALLLGLSNASKSRDEEEHEAKKSDRGGTSYVIRD
ncbi:MAG: 4Fe-4S dicluster domain-containing protein [Deltaproteobacteria bacterium]|nr:4Fe-4S dicluster domain-containing protein [Deltaproteobacteria bacterium]